MVPNPNSERCPDDGSSGFSHSNHLEALTGQRNHDNTNSTTDHRSPTATTRQDILGLFPTWTNPQPSSWIIGCSNVN
ncbi:hypothetical protein IWW37_006081, partial [Coemansia sp. RSA 2050]